MFNGGQVKKEQTSSQGQETKLSPTVAGEEGKLGVTMIDRGERERE